jgi:hypothetical protein
VGRIALALLAVLCALGTAPAAWGVTGEQRILLVLVTWGPEPVTQAEARATFESTGAFVRSASFGRTWLAGEVTPWLHALRAEPSSCDLGAIDAAGRAAAARAGFDPARFETIGYALPRFEACRWGGAYFPPGLWVNGPLTREVIAHELGHTYGVTEEGTAWICDRGRCEARPYADPYSVMGHGGSDFGAYEKSVFGWLDRIPVLDAPAELELGAIDRPSTLPQALRILAAGDEYWLEYRPPVPLWPYAEDAAPGVVVHAGPHGADDEASRYGSRDLLVGTASAGGRFAVPGTLALDVLAAGPERARVRFRWTDTKPPPAPRVTVQARGAAVVRWRPSTDGGSGVAAYELRVDRGRPRRLAAVRSVGPKLGAVDLELRVGRLVRGRHRVTAVAIDRAGNRSRPATRVFVVG